MKINHFCLIYNTENYNGVHYFSFYPYNYDGFRNRNMPIHRVCGFDKKTINHFHIVLCKINVLPYSFCSICVQTIMEYINFYVSPFICNNLCSIDIPIYIMYVFGDCVRWLSRKNQIWHNVPNHLPLRVIFLILPSF